MSLNKVLMLVGTGFVLVCLVITLPMLVEDLRADELMVIQMPWTGELRVYTDPGTYAQWFGKVTTYKKRTQFSFSAKKNQGATTDESLPVGFNDGGQARVSGVLSWEMPLSKEKVIKIHTLYGSPHAIEQQLVRPAIERALYFSGPLMSSTESYQSRRAEFLQVFEDQAKNGLYQTETISVKQPDPVTNQEKTANVTKVVIKDGVPLRRSESALKEFGILLLPPAIDDFNYDDVVKKQIAAQQQAVAQIQTAQAQAREAEQRAITAMKNGEADAAKAKWMQETIKATEVTKAEQEKAVALLAASRELEVARLGAQAAEQTKRQQILLGEGEAERKRLVMNADGALAQKLDTWLSAQKVYAAAIAESKNPLVPGIIIGSSANSAQSSVQSLMDMLSIKTARELSLDMGVVGHTTAPKK